MDEQPEKDRKPFVRPDDRTPNMELQMKSLPKQMEYLTVIMKKKSRYFSRSDGKWSNF